MCRHWINQVDAFESWLNHVTESDMKALDKQIGGNHYKGMAIQPGLFCQKNKLRYMESNAIKYISRHHLKGKAEDIRKAIHCLELVLEWEYGDTTNQTD